MSKKNLTKKIAQYTAAAGALTAVAGNANAQLESMNVMFSEGVTNGMLVEHGDHALLDFDNDGIPEMMVAMLWGDEMQPQDAKQGPLFSTIFRTYFSYAKYGVISPSPIGTIGQTSAPADAKADNQSSSSVTEWPGVLNEFFWNTRRRDVKNIDTFTPPGSSTSTSSSSSFLSTLGSSPYQFGFVKKLEQGELINRDNQEIGQMPSSLNSFIMDADIFSPIGLVAFKGEGSATGDLKQDNFPQHGETGFAGFRWPDGQPDEFKYGWLEMEVGNSTPYIKIGNGAMETHPDLQVRAGDMSPVPFAPIASALGLGLIGLFGYMRRRKQA